MLALLQPTRLFGRSAARCIAALPCIANSEVRWLPLQAAAQSLFTEQVQLNFGRVLLTWLLHLVVFELQAAKEAARAGERHYARCTRVGTRYGVRALSGTA